MGNKNIWYCNRDAINDISSVCLTLDDCLNRGDTYSAQFAQGLFKLANAVTRLREHTNTQEFENYGWLSRMLYDAHAKGYAYAIAPYSGENPDDITLFRDAYKQVMIPTFDQKYGTDKRLTAQAQDGVARLIGFCVYLSKGYNWGNIRKEFNPVDAIFENISAYNLFMSWKTQDDGWNTNHW